jgi:hypothetical protein
MVVIVEREREELFPRQSQPNSLQPPRLVAKALVEGEREEELIPQRGQSYSLQLPKPLVMMVLLLLLLARVARGAIPGSTNPTWPGRPPCHRQTMVLAFVTVAVVVVAVATMSQMMSLLVMGVE